MRTLVVAIALTIAPHVAHADDDETALVVDATWIQPRRGIAPSAGAGAELRFIGDREPFTMSMGGFAALAQNGPGETGRDIFDVHFQVGAKMSRRARLIVPYAALGFDVLHVTTHEPMRDVRGTTLGISVAGGVLGTIGDKLVYRATVGYLGAIVPGTGDDLGGVILQLGIGARLDD